MNRYKMFCLAASACFILLTANHRLSAQSERMQVKTIHLDASILDSYQGQYRFQDEPDAIVSFSHRGAILYADAPRRPTAELLPESEAAFSEKESSVKFAFVTGPGGKVSAVKMSFRGRERLANKVSDQPAENHFRTYDAQDVMIPMRDGIKLHAIILRPKDMDAALPFILERTPYGADIDSDALNERYTELAQSGYIFVFEDIRGRFKSEGQFVMMRPLADHRDPKQFDESTDTYDTVAWLLKNVPNNNRRVGVFGVSYGGFLTMEAGIDPHPAVKAISPQAPMTDVWMGDDFFHNGAFRQSYGYDYVLGMESSKENAFGKLDEDAYDYFLQSGSFAGAIQKSGAGELPTWKSFVKDPSYNSFWSSLAVQPHLTRATVPTLEVGGYWDQEDMWGPQEEYASLKRHDPSHEIFLVLGPWNHGQWASSSRSLGAVDFGHFTTDEFRRQLEAPFFAHYLKDEGSFDLKDTASFQSGSDIWKRYSHWPPTQGIEARNLYVGRDNSLSFTKPTGSADSDFTAYTSDPANPVPYRKRPIEATYAPGGSGWYTWLVQDQRFLEGRKDIASWSTPVLDHDVTVTGDVIADLFASTSGTDSDWVVKLIDVYPDDVKAIDPDAAKMAGYQLMISDEIFRGRYRTSFEKPAAIPANKVEEYKFSLHAADHVFLKGHRIMVQVQSSWFPLYDRNPQTFVPNIMTAAPKDYQSATQRIYWSAEYPSHIELPVAMN